MNWTVKDISFLHANSLLLWPLRLIVAYIFCAFIKHTYLTAFLNTTFTFLFGLNASHLQQFVFILWYIVGFGLHISNITTDIKEQKRASLNCRSSFQFKMIFLAANTFTVIATYSWLILGCILSCWPLLSCASVLRTLALTRSQPPTDVPTRGLPFSGPMLLNRQRKASIYI